MLGEFYPWVQVGLCMEGLVNVFHASCEHLDASVSCVVLSSLPHSEGWGTNWSYVSFDCYSIIYSYGDSQINKFYLWMVWKQYHPFIYYPQESQYDIIPIYLGQHVQPNGSFMSVHLYHVSCKFRTQSGGPVISLYLLRDYRNALQPMLCCIGKRYGTICTASGIH